MRLYATTYGIILVVLIGFLAAGIFADEFSLKADAVFFSCRYSRTKAVRSKILTGLLMATVIYWTGMALLSGISFAVMGVSGFNTPYQLEQPYCIYNITFGQEYLIILVCGYIASLLSASVAMLVSAKTHSANIAVCIPFILFCVSPFIGRALPFGTFFPIDAGSAHEYIELCKRALHLSDREPGVPADPVCHAVLYSCGGSVPSGDLSVL